ncbi:MAG: type II toxin-antitoxin system RelE/ParE family toxin [Phycisphaeraceae bacterium]
MSRPVTFHRAARAELHEAAQWYNAETAGLGDEFLTEIKTALTRIALMPEAFPNVYRDIHKAVITRRFDYCVYFRIRADDSIRILSVFHTSRNPSIWMLRR